MSSSTHTLLTLDEFAKLPEDGLIHELSNGELITMSHPKSDHGLVVGRLIELFMAYLFQQRVGSVYNQMGFLLAPGTVRGPDLAFLTNVSISRIKKGEWYPGAPDLAIEVVSPSDEASDLRRKVREYLDAGAKSVWVLYPDSKEVDIYRQHGVENLRDSDLLTESDLLPGFSLAVSSLFD
jgi:Uma2 family endonuclease